MLDVWKRLLKPVAFLNKIMRYLRRELGKNIEKALQNCRYSRLKRLHWLYDKNT